MLQRGTVMYQSQGAHRPSLSARVPGDTVPSPSQLRHQEQREDKLKDIREQVASGKLVIRQMTPEERKRFPVRPPGAARAKRR